MRPSRLISLAAALVLTGAAALAQAPARVVSLNVCTDQLAMLLAAPGQIAAVSKLSRDPRTSSMAEAARDYPVTGGAAEAVVLLEPDLVLAGRWTTRATVQMLERLGYWVETFDPATSLADARANIERMGALLGREDRAAEVIARFDARLAALRETPEARPRAVLYQPHGATAGPGSLADDILASAGIENIGGGTFAMEELVLAEPDLILVGEPYGGHARATEYRRHPALRATGALREVPDGADWVCETPHLLDAVATMRALRRDWEAAR
ncbi:ABC transporter substrate-binding protein [Salipiger mucosus]|uniref:Vitamin B12 ABC transporter n=1 Tax=Salipiger mucosus DSM 16094 TaxID=1123237 RepID=S9S7H9_9RHOB|nr:ABC transporter substrate-binding protein [Salipiger mucosus]EPX82179.1 Vitamin B12 ABC transporter [Salipiger mucosus DSM 16094]